LFDEKARESAYIRGMNIDLAALPDDVKMLQQMVRSLAVERTTALAAAQSEIERLRLIVQKLQRNQFGRRSERLDTISCSLDLKILRPISRGSRPSSYQLRRSLPHPSLRSIDQACRRICPARTCGSTLSIRPAPAVVASCM